MYFLIYIPQHIVVLWKEKLALRSNNYKPNPQAVNKDIHNETPRILLSRISLARQVAPGYLPQEFPTSVKATAKDMLVLCQNGVSGRNGKGKRYSMLIVAMAPGTRAARFPRLRMYWRTKLGIPQMPGGEDHPQ